MGASLNQEGTSGGLSSVVAPKNVDFVALNVEELIFAVEKYGIEETLNYAKKLKEDLPGRVTSAVFSDEGLIKAISEKLDIPWCQSSASDICNSIIEIFPSPERIFNSKHVLDGLVKSLQQHLELVNLETIDLLKKCQITEKTVILALLTTDNSGWPEALCVYDLMPFVPVKRLEGILASKDVRDAISDNLVKMLSDDRGRGIETTPRYMETIDKIYCRLALLEGSIDCEDPIFIDDFYHKGRIRSEVEEIFTNRENIYNALKDGIVSAIERTSQVTGIYAVIEGNIVLETLSSYSAFVNGYCDEDIVKSVLGSTEVQDAAKKMLQEIETLNSILGSDERKKISNMLRKLIKDYGRR